MSSVGAFGFALEAARLPGRWYAAAAAIISFPYLVFGRWLGPLLRSGVGIARRRTYAADKRG